MAHGPKPGDIIIHANEHRSLFVERVLDGRQTQLLADSTTWRRKRYLNAFKAEGHAEAPAFTEKKIREYGAPHVAAHLAEVGINLEPGTQMYFLGSTYGKPECKNLGAVPTDWN